MFQLDNKAAREMKMEKYLSVISLVFLFCFTIACQDKAARAELEKAKTQAQLEEQNKVIVRQFFEAIDAQNYVRMKELLTPEFVLHYSGPQEDFSGEALMQLVRVYYTAFPDGIHKFEDIFAEGNKVVSRALWEGTHKTDFQGIPATGIKVSFYQIGISTVVDGKIKECWVVEDNLGMMTQLGMELKLKEVAK
jgi:predicted ester cyclase